MPGLVNWSAAPQPVNVLGNYQAGQQIGKQNAIHNALTDYATDPDGAIAKVTALDPEAGIRLGQARQQQVQAQTQAHIQAAHNVLAASVFGGGQGKPSAQTPQPQPAQPGNMVQLPGADGLAPPSSIAAPTGQDVTVTGGKPKPDIYDITRPIQYAPSQETIKAAQDYLTAGGDSETVKSLISMGHQLSDPHAQQVEQLQQTTVKVLAQAKNIEADPVKNPDGSVNPQATAAQTAAMRKSFVLSQIPHVVGDKQAAQGLYEAALNADYSDNGIDGYINQTQSTADVLKASRQDAADAQKQGNADRTFGETVRHNKASEGIGSVNARAHMLSATKPSAALVQVDGATPVTVTKAPSGSVIIGNADKQ
jgi:hypothetical protein